jgi:hypothetical protein
MRLTSTGLTTQKDATIYGLTVGRGAGAVGTNTVVGSGALATSNTGPRQTAIGYRALSAYSGSVGYNTAIGSDALQNTTGSYDNVAVGDAALNGVSNGNGNVAVGNNAILFNQTGSSNTAVGHSALRGASLNSFSNNTAVGYQAGYNNTTGAGGVFIGYTAGLGNTTASYNIGIGSETLSAAAGNYNVAVGRAALNVTTGANNTAIGGLALQNNTTASNNTAVGYQAGYSNTTGADNVFIGDRVAYSNLSGARNTIVGKYAGYDHQSGDRNLIIGPRNNAGNGAGQFLYTGSDNVYVGGYDGYYGGAIDLRYDSGYLAFSDGFGRPLIITKNGQTVALQNAVVNATGTGITFPATQNASADANTLDDYEEGTWTPSAFISYQSGTITTTSSTGTYTKIGRYVYCYFDLTINLSWSVAGNIGVTGLPFNAAAIYGIGGAFGGARRHDTGGEFYSVEGVYTNQIQVIRRYDNGGFGSASGIRITGWVTYTV